jgi:hypothetical protein
MRDDGGIKAEMNLACGKSRLESFFAASPVNLFCPRQSTSDLPQLLHFLFISLGLLDPEHAVLFGVLGVEVAYALARKEFRTAIPEVVAVHHPGSSVDLEPVAASLLQALS